MKTPKTFFSLFGILALVILSLGFVSAASLTTWALTSNESSTTADPNVNAGDFVEGPGLSSFGFGPDGATASPWTTGLTPDSSDYFEVTIAPKSGFELTVTDVKFGERRSNDGPMKYQVQWSKSASFSSPTTIATETPPNNTNERTGDITGLSIQVNEGETLRIRWFGYDAVSSSGTWRINDGTLEILGTVTPIVTNTGIQINGPANPVENGQNASVTVKNTGTTATTGITLSEVTNFGATFNPTSISGLGVGATSSPIEVILDALTDIKFGLNILTIKAEAQSGEVATANIQFNKHFCEVGEVGTRLKIRNIDVDNRGEGDDDKWELLDEVEIEVEVRNNDDDDDKDVIIVLGLFDSDGRNVGDDLEYSVDSDGDDEEIEVNINDDDEETRIYKFRVPADLDSGKYKLAIKAYNDDDGEDVDCADTSADLNQDFYQDIDIDRVTDDERMIVVDDISIDSQTSCGETVSGQFTVYNIGNEKQERVRITLKNSDLSLDKEFEITRDLDEGEDETLSYSFQVPTGAENGNYPINFRTYYDYKNGNYREISEDTFTTQLSVLGCSRGVVNLGTGAGNSLITVKLKSDNIVAGEELMVEATITNTGTETETYIVGVTRYSSWAELDSISEGSLTLGHEESKTVTLKFTIKEDASGTETFNIQTTSPSGVNTQEVEVNIKGSSSGFNLEGDNLIWVIAVVNIILILLIIIVAVRLSRR
jgi:hypothetical protein